MLQPGPSDGLSSAARALRSGRALVLDSAIASFAHRYGDRLPEPLRRLFAAKGLQLDSRPRWCLAADWDELVTEAARAFFPALPLATALRQLGHGSAEGYV